jgi:tetratricopeptide (TPR) repeat protein
MALNKDRVFKAAEKYIRSNKFDKAIAEYESWLKENPKDWNIIRTVGDLYARISRNDEAIKKYAQVADHYRKDGFNVRAIATLKMVLRLDPQNEPAMRSLAELQAEEGLLMEAKSYYQTLVELYNKQGHKRLASEVFKKLAEIDPQDVKIRYKYADFLNKNGKPDEAALEYVGIADQFISQGLVEEAIKILEQGRSLQTSDPALKVKLAQAFSMQGNHAQAIRMLEEVRRTASGDPGVLARLGEAYLAAGNTDDAQAVFQELSALQPGKPENVLRLAELRIAQSKFDTALEELSPLVDKHVAAGEGHKATELLQKVLAKDPYHVKTLLKLAEIHTILRQDSGRAAAYDSLCEAYSRVGDFERAAQVAEQLVELDPESSQHKDRLKFFKSKLAGPARAPEPARPASPPPRPAAPPPSRPAGGPSASTPAPPRAAPPAAPARPAPAPPAARPAPPPPQARQAPAPAPAPPPARAPAPAPLESDFGGFGEDDLSAAVSASFGSDMGLGEPAAASPVASIDLGEMVELTQEDEENIKEKLTEAEVFVRYGLVDKAIGQLVDVLESFRFHVETREKLIEIYKDQGMNREAGEQLMHLAQVYERLGRAQDAATAREEATQANPALAAQMASVGFVGEEEPELILAPETESDLGDVGIEVDLPPMGAAEEEFLSFGGSAEDDTALGEPEIDISLDEVAPPPSAPEEIPLEVDWGAASGAAGAIEDEEFSLDVEEPADAVDEEIPIAIEDEPAVSHASGLGLGSVGGSTPLAHASSSDIEIDLGTSSVDIPFSIEEPVDAADTPDESVAADSHGPAEVGEIDLPVDVGTSDDEFEVSLDDAGSHDGTDTGLGEDEFSVEIDGGDEFSVELPDVAEVEDAGFGVDAADEAAETFAPSFDDIGDEAGAASEGGIQIDIPSSADIEVDFSTLGDDDDIEAQAESPLELPVPEPPPPVARVAAKPQREVEAVRPPPPASAPPPKPTAPISRPEPPPAAPPPRVAASPVAAELEEVDEYIALGLYEDARDTLRELLKQHPGQPDILAKIDELGFSSEQIQKEAVEPARLLKTPELEAPRPARVAQPAAPTPTRARARAPEPEPELDPLSSALDELEEDRGVESLEDELAGIESLVGASEAVSVDAPHPSSDGGDFIDLASELSEEIFGTHSAIEEEEAEPEGPLTDPGLDQIFREFRKGVEKQLGAEDYDTRYNLGIAYKEMGLLDEAIAEFQLAAKDEVRSLECCSMLGLCFMEKGLPEIAIKWFSKGLAIPGRREEEYHGLRYDLAQAYEAAGQPERALQLYMEIFRENVKFRDVQERVKELQAARK